MKFSPDHLDQLWWLKWESPCLTRSLKPWNYVKWQGYVDNKYVQTLAQQVRLPTTFFCFMCNHTWISVVSIQWPRTLHGGLCSGQLDVMLIGHCLALPCWYLPLLEHFGWRPADHLNWTVWKNCRTILFRKDYVTRGCRKRWQTPCLGGNGRKLLNCNKEDLFQQIDLSWLYGSCAIQALRTEDARLDSLTEDTKICFEMGF